MITDLMEIYKIVTKGTTVTTTEVRRDPYGIPTIVQLTAYKYKGKTYRTSLDANLQLILIEKK